MVKSTSRLRPQRVTATKNTQIQKSLSEDDSSDEEYFVPKSSTIKKPQIKYYLNPEKPTQATIRIKTYKTPPSSEDEMDQKLTITLLPKSSRHKKCPSKLMDYVTVSDSINVTKTKRKTKPTNHLTELIELSSPSSPEKQRKLSNKEDVNPQKTPEKQNKINYKLLSEKTPEKTIKQTPNKRNENVPETPSSMLNNLSLNSPNYKSRKSLFKENNNVYQSARKALHSSLPTSMTEREKELKYLKEFINEHLENDTSGTLYVSGPPGTGKTACLNMILEQKELSLAFNKVYVNCTTMKSSGAIYSRIVKDLKIKTKGKTEKEYLNAIENYLGKNHKMILLVLDEIDQLESKKQSILYTIFEWPAKPSSKLILIGIANALDLTDRILPRLQARCELKPTLLHFTPYTKQQIVNIITTRLHEAGVANVFHPAALQMLAGKVAAMSGDVRRALDIGRRLVEIVEQNKKNNVLTSLENLTNQLIEDEENAVKPVDLKEVVNILNNIYSTTQNLNDNVDESFPLQQKIIVCTLLLMMKNAKNKNVTIGRLHEAYKKICSKKNLLAVDQGEFVGLCSLIESKGMIKVGKKKETRMHTVSLEWDEEEVVSALKDKQLLSSILDDEQCLGKI